MSKSLLNRKKMALVIQGGTMRSIFTAGVLDAFMAMKFNPFNYYIGVSGGAMCLTYYLTKQRRCSYKILQSLYDDDKFINWRNMFSEQGMINLEYLINYSQDTYPLNKRKVNRKIITSKVEIVATSMDSGKPVYLSPTKFNILDIVKASATLPFLTKGEQLIDGKQRLMDGGWSDPIPVKRAISLGYEDIVVIRTYPAKHREKWTYFGKIGGYWHKNNPQLSELFDKDYSRYNDVADYLDEEHDGLNIYQICPDDYLETTSYSTTRKKLDIDYQYGLHLGINLADQLKRRIFKKKIV